MLMLVLNTAACPGSQSGDRDIMEKHSQLPLTMTLLMPIYRKSFLELLDQCFIYKYLLQNHGGQAERHSENEGQKHYYPSWTCFVIWVQEVVLRSPLPWTSTNRNFKSFIPSAVRFLNADRSRLDECFCDSSFSDIYPLYSVYLFWTFMFILMYLFTFSLTSLLVYLCLDVQQCSWLLFKDCRLCEFDHVSR